MIVAAPIWSINHQSCLKSRPFSILFLARNCYYHDIIYVFSIMLLYEVNSQNPHQSDLYSDMPSLWGRVLAHFLFSLSKPFRRVVEVWHQHQSKKTCEKVRELRVNQWGGQINQAGHGLTDVVSRVLTVSKGRCGSSPGNTEENVTTTPTLGHKALNFSISN